jgi:hypothetical protein
LDHLLSYAPKLRGVDGDGNGRTRNFESQLRGCPLSETRRRGGLCAKSLRVSVLSSMAREISGRRGWSNLQEIRTYSALLAGRPRHLGIVPDWGAAAVNVCSWLGWPMANRRHNPRLAKKNRTYSVPEAAALYSVHKNTVRGWQKAGLEPIDRKRPVLFLGITLAAFHQARRAKAKQPLLPGQIYCVACRDAKTPALGLADHVPLTATLGDLVGLCPTCERIIFRRVSWDRLTQAAGHLDVTFRDALSHLEGTPARSLNCDLKRRGSA